MLLRNWHSHATVPSRGLYPPPVELGLRLHRARTPAPGAAPGGHELLSIFGAQWADGRVPYIAFNPAIHDKATFRVRRSGVRTMSTATRRSTRPASSNRPCTRWPPAAPLLHGHLESGFVFGYFRGDALVGLCGIGFRSILMRHRSQIGQPLASAQV